MPLSISVGLSRKASKDYQSTGVSINVTAELDQSLLARPQELQQQIDALYEQAERALDRRSSVPRQHGVHDHQRAPGQRAHGGNGRNSESSNGNGAGRAGMTSSQRRAIEAIARRLDLDAALEAREIIGADFDDLSIRQASELIDYLKSQQPASSGKNGGGR